ncbi:MAG: winged helix-turn-helix domain-containing protein [Peptococcaceae bacterium]|jgi:DNA-binding SARP family transcriptional activator|nr:winged helix-turn-helix domain-containing protein [Peptococcaceae bacterium]
MAIQPEESSISGSENLIRINMFGDFKLVVGDKVIDDSISRSHKMWVLLAFLIIHRQRFISQEELIDVLWPEEDNDNPANALKTLLYRTRASIASILGEEIQLILSQRGSYSWNMQYNIRTDAEDFDQYVTMAADISLERQDRKDYYQKAMVFYQHDFLPKLSDQMWVIPFTTYYHYLFLDSVFAYGEMLLADGEYAKLIDLCNQAVKIEPFEEKLYTMLIKAFLAQGNTTAAINQYEKATDLLYRNLGVRPSEGLRELYQDIMKENKMLELDLTVIQQDLREAAARSGPFICEYGFFREAYRLEARRATRQGTSVQIALITLSLPDGKSPTLTLLNKTMEQVLSVLEFCLRRGDVVARYSGAQYVLMLPTANFEDATMVMERIVSTFSHRNRKSFLKLNYKIQQLDLEKMKAYN